MVAIRLIAIAVLVYLVYRMVQNFSRKKERDLSVTTSKKQDQQKADMLMEDPVCKKLVPQHQAVIWQKDGETFYFCSGQCCAIFQEKQGERR